MHPRRLAPGAHAHLKPASGTFSAATRSVITRPDPRLQVIAEEVDPCHPDVVALAGALVTTMRASPACFGLAATQIGSAMRLFCMDVSNHRKTRSCAGLVVMCNPIIVRRTHDVTMREGCLSVPHLTGNVTRAAEVIVEGHVPGTGRLLRVSADALEARCLQHEIDHLDGFVFVDRVRDPCANIFTRVTYA